MDLIWISSDSLSLADFAATRGDVRFVATFFGLSGSLASPSGPDDLFRDLVDTGDLAVAERVCSLVGGFLDDEVAAGVLI